MNVASVYDRLDVADEVIHCVRGVTLEKYVRHELIICMADTNRYEIYARIIEDLGNPVYLYDITHHHDAEPEDFCFGVGVMRISCFHEFRNIKKGMQPTEEFLQIVISRMQPLRRWIQENKALFPFFLERFEQDDEFLRETIAEPFSITAEHFKH
jgi:hypothetical protein